jgi:hypothetical protein
MRYTVRVLAGLSILLGAYAGTATAQAAPTRLRVLGDADRVVLHNLRGAAFSGASLAVLTEPEPGVHLFAGGQHRGWGDKGNGPAELENPENVAWVGGRILVHDFRGANGKIVSYDASGGLAAVRSTGDCGLARGFQVSGPDTLLSSVDFGSRRRAIVRLSGSGCDTIARYTVPEQIRMTAPGSPPLTLTPPFAAGPLWAALPGRRVAAWSGVTPTIMILDTRGRTVGQLPLPKSRFRISDADRDWWISREIPEDFMGRRVFEPLRRKARQDLEFPNLFPPAIAFLADPGGGVWLQRTTSGSGEVWTLVTPAGERASFKLPPGRELLAVGQAELAVRARDALDVETVEIYRKPQA